MQLTVNGTLETTCTGATVTDLISEHNLHPLHVAVELNQKLISRKLFDSTSLSEGDTVEIVTFVGGG